MSSKLNNVSDELHELFEWYESIDSMIMYNGADYTSQLLDKVIRYAEKNGIVIERTPSYSYENTIPCSQDMFYPGNHVLEKRIVSIIRWNALMMVMRSNREYGDLGGHISSYASAAEIFETGFNHFFKGGNNADLVYFQPHSAPGIYARAFLEGRLDESYLNNYRQECDGNGLSSYPHPWLMPDFWQFPTGSMGLGPISSIYNARFMRYLSSRGFGSMESRYVWGVYGDGEMDEPESISALSFAAREKLNNLTFVINCNLQRLDGPVRGNSQIITELEQLFKGVGWKVIKVLWGSEWDRLFEKDTKQVLLRRFSNTVDGEFQTLAANDGAYNLKHFFSSDPELAELVADMDASDIEKLNRGGHDLIKLYSAFKVAREYTDGPSVILAKTIKGFGMGDSTQSRMVTHQKKKLNFDDLKRFRDRFSLPLSDQEIENYTFVKLSPDSDEIRYLKSRRDTLGGYLPKRTVNKAHINVPPLEEWAKFALASNTNSKSSSTTSFIKMLTGLMKHSEIGFRIVPIVADEARTFGMASLFRRFGIYSPNGQLYIPEDSSSLLAYKESSSGQLLEEGITEAGALASWTAAATSYSVHGIPMLPFYIYYSMFGFQRVGDLIWAAADQRARGFLIGATAGKTTLGGEGLQHQDGSSHIIASTVPNCRAYDPCYAYELAIILEHGICSMLEKDIDEFYYITVMNENYIQPVHSLDNKSHIIKGLHRISDSAHEVDIRLLGSGAILREVEAAATLLKEWSINAEVLSATSYSELERDARELERSNRLNPDREPRVSHVESLLGGDIPVVAVTDYVRAVPQLISSYISSPYTVLGTDGFGRSDTRLKLREFFEIDRYNIVIAALYSLVSAESLAVDVLVEAIEEYSIKSDKPSPWSV